MRKISLNKVKIMLGVLALTLVSALSATELMGAGASFPYPLYAKMFSVYNAEKGVQVNYQSVGSGGGIKAITDRLVDFGATDGFLTDEQLTKMPAKVLHIPICLGSVALTYNLPGNPQLQLTPEVISDIFLGKIKSWDDKRIQDLNPDVKLPKNNILVVHRSDGSGTTAIFTDYLSKVSREWKNKVGAGTSVKWPTGIGGSKNDGVTALVKQTPGAIGYVEFIYALSNKLPAAAVKNKSGNFIMPDIKSTGLAADATIPADTRVSLTDTPVANGYSIAGFTWLLIYQEQNYNQRSLEQAKALVDLLWWMTHEGQELCEPMKYGKLPNATLTRTEEILKTITYQGKNLL